MGSQVNIYEAKSQLSQLVERASGGEEIIIAKAGKPMARLVPLEKPKNRVMETFGKNIMGITYVAPDFDDEMPLEIFLGEDAEGKAPRE